MSATNRTERMWIGGAALLGLLVAVVGWFLLISPQRDETAQVQGQTSDAQLQNLTLQTRISKLNTEKAKSSTYLAALARAQQALPAQSNMSVFIRDVQAIASATSTQVTALNVGDPAAATPAAAAPTASASSASPSSAVPAPGAAAAAGGIFAIPIDVSVVGRTAPLTNFLTRLQSSQPRAVLISSVTRNANSDTGAGSGTSVLQLKMTAFVAPRATPATSASPPGS